MSDEQTDPAPVLILESGGGVTEELVRRLDALGVKSVVADDLDEARLRIEQASVMFRVAMLPTDLEWPDLKKDVKSLRATPGGDGLTFVSVGKAPAPADRKRLRSARVTLALWEPYDDGALRFQLNRAFNSDRDDHKRREARVPTYLLARVRSGDRMKDAVIYSLSEGGAFLETPRASMDGAHIDVEIRLPERTVCGPALVKFANVPGNLQRPNLPMGMGVRFEDWPKESAKALRAYVEERLGQLNV